MRKSSPRPPRSVKSRSQLGATPLAADRQSRHRSVGMNVTRFEPGQDFVWGQAHTWPLRFGAIVEHHGFWTDTLGDSRRPAHGELVMPSAVLRKERQCPPWPDEPQPCVSHRLKAIPYIWLRRKREHTLDDAAAVRRQERDPARPRCHDGGERR